MNVELSEAQRKRLEEIAFQRGEKPEDILRDVIAEGLKQLPDGGRADAQRKALLGLVDEMRSLPVVHPDNGFRGRDHDRILYDRHA